MEQSAIQSNVTDLLCVIVHVGESPVHQEAAAWDLPAGDSGTLLTTFAQAFFTFDGHDSCGCSWVTSFSPESCLLVPLFSLSSNCFSNWLALSLSHHAHWNYQYAPLCSHLSNVAETLPAIFFFFAEKECFPFLFFLSPSWEGLLYLLHFNEPERW